MTSYAVAHLREVDRGPAVVEYLQRIDATLAPFDGTWGSRVTGPDTSW
jgi:hypothetical protein